MNAKKLYVKADFSDATRSKSKKSTVLFERTSVVSSRLPLAALAGNSET
jgi:hypothetical protein